MRPKHPTTHTSRRVRLPEFMWQALEVLTPYVNERAIADPGEYLSLSGLIECILLSAIKPQTLRILADNYPEFQQAISEWVAVQIEREPETAVIFNSAIWNFTKRTN